MKRVLVTGATGFIGRHCIAPLLALGYEVHAVSSKPPQSADSGVHWHRLDLLDSAQLRGLLTRVQPTHLLHLAWYMIPEKYPGAPENLLWVQASLELLRRFQEHGGERAVLAGSSFEYDWNYGYCSEFTTAKAPTTIYGTCKNALASLVEAYSGATQLSAAWARIFFLYGPHEHPERLVSSVIRSLLRGEPARCSHGNQIRDYLYVQDVADALVAIMETQVQGPVNVGSGRHLALRDIIGLIGKKLNQEDLILLGTLPSRPNDFPVVVADARRLFQEVGWQPRYDLEQGLDHTIQWWKHQLDGRGS